MELSLIGGFGLTRSPADAPWRERRREHELGWRGRTPRRLQVWAEVLHGLARVATLGLRGRAPSLGRSLRQELRARRATLVGGPEDGHAPVPSDGAGEGARAVARDAD